MRALPLFTLLCLGACADGGTAPDLQLSIVLADGRSCRDAGLSKIELRYGTDKPPSYACNNVVAPGAVTATQLPLSDSVEIAGLSIEDAELYRGSFVPADVLDGPTTAVTITLYPAAAR